MHGEKVNNRENMAVCSRTVWMAGPSFQMKKGHYLADVLAVKNAAFGKDFHREQGDYELPGLN